jgi:hypothetical protein
MSHVITYLFTPSGYRFQCLIFVLNKLRLVHVRFSLLVQTRSHFTQVEFTRASAPLSLGKSRCLPGQHAHWCATIFAATGDFTENGEGLF